MPRNLQSLRADLSWIACTDHLVGREATKGVIRFELDEPVPEAVVRRLAAWNPADGAATKKPATRSEQAKRRR